MDDLETLLSEAIDALRIYRGRTFSWFGEREQWVALSPRQHFEYLPTRLQDHLYRNFYSIGMAAPPEDDEGEASAVDASAFVEQLSRANCGKGVTLAGANLILRPGRIKELRAISPGFYTALSDARLDSGTPLLRIYWNLRPEGAVPFIRQSTQMLNELSIPFRAKVVNDPLFFKRCDAAVLYVPRRQHREIWPVIGALHRSLRRHLKSLTPVFAKRIDRGIAVAEDPPGQESFGQHRCGIVADGLVRAHEKQRTTTAARIDEVIAQFRRRGLSFCRPFLNHGSKDVYPLLSA